MNGKLHKFGDERSKNHEVNVLTDVEDRKLRPRLREECIRKCSWWPAEATLRGTSVNEGNFWAGLTHSAHSLEVRVESAAHAKPCIRNCAVVGYSQSRSGNLIRGRKSWQIH